MFGIRLGAVIFATFICLGKSSIQIYFAVEIMLHFMDTESVIEMKNYRTNVDRGWRIQQFLLGDGNE